VTERPDARTIKEALERERVISDRRPAEFAVRESESQYRLLFVSNPSPMWVFDEETLRIVAVNDAAIQQYGWTRPEFLAMTVLDVRLAEDRASARDVIERHRGAYDTNIGMVRHCRKDGTPMEVEISVSSIHFSGRPARLCSMNDVTARRRSEEALRGCELLMQQSRDILLLVRRDDGRILEANLAAAVAYGYSRDELLALSIHELRAPGTERLTESQLVEADARGLLFESIHRRRDGSTFPVEVSSRGVAIGETRTLVSVVRDTTERKLVEAALLRAYGRTTAILESIADAFYSLDDQWRFVVVNPAAERAPFGRPASDLLGKVIWDVFPSIVGTRIHQHYLDAVEKHRREHYEAPSPLNGRWYEVFMFPQAGGLDVYLRDIDDRKKTEEALRNAYDGLEQMIRDRTADLQAANRILRMISACNEALVRVADETALLRQVCQIIHEQGGCRMVWIGYAEDDAMKKLRPVASAGFEDGYLDTAQITWADEQRGRGPTGTCVRTQTVQVCRNFLTDPAVLPWRDHALKRGYQSSIALPLRSGGRVFGALTIYASAPDAFDEGEVELLTELADDLALGITGLRTQVERDQARQEAEDRAEQLRALAAELGEAEQRERGRLARVIHDHLQQLLVGAKLNLAALAPKTAARSQRQAADRVTAILDEAIREARSLTADLSLPVLHEKGLVAGIEWLSQQVQQQHRLKVAVKADAGAEPAAETVRMFLFDAVRELLFNVVKHSGSDRATVEIRKSAAGQVQVVVADSGVGFDPYQLKASGSFGLFSIRERLRHLGGQLDVESGLGKGSRFTMSVPAGAERPSDGVGPTRRAGPPTPTIEVAEPRSGGRKTRILVADDHPAMRQGLSRLLREQPGFEVVGEAGDGVEAVEIARQLRPDVVLMDVRMPRASGLEATMQIASEFPGIRVIGLSMDATDDTSAAMLKAGAVAYLAKGCPVEELMAAVRACVGSPGKEDAV